MSAISTPKLTLYFDGNCPFCAAEMHRLKNWNNAGNLAFTDIAAGDFSPDFLGVTMQALGQELHSLTDQGELLVGLDSMLVAYTLVGRAWMVAPLRIRLLRPALSSLYRSFARNRYRMSALLGYKIPACDEGVCRRENPFL
ncbi:thiol-disulfide oxidoreductase DCC family protein [Undibacterium sp. Xuan67W]|uniref:thiol-disulfide oxidoreductase DCC family protein n=1 Tax=Undibacterium sp. Xuan67W TaxID=3413057 RepID=UPI003BF215B5